jgi:phospholipid/cholesterol/gamma-HCH transport system substrate-binding protein
MPRTRSLAWSELKIGVLTIVAIGIAGALIFTLTGTRGFAWQRYTLKTRLTNVAGLAKGSPVRVAGVEVGSVKAVEFAGEQVDIVFDMRDDLKDRITTGSVARLGSVSLLGEGAIDITPSSSGTPIPEWGYVPSGKPPAQISDVTEQAASGVQEITGLVRDLRAGRGTAGKLMTDEQLYTEMNRFVAAAGDVTQTLKQGRGTVGKLLNDPRAAESLQASMANLEEMTRRINAGEGSLGSLMKDDAFAKSLNGATDNLRTLVDRLNRGEGTAGKLMTDPTLFNRLNDVTGRLSDLTTRLNELTTRLNNGEGTAGLLLKDKQLYENMNGAVNEVRALIAEIKKDPKRYLNVRVSIF